LDSRVSWGLADRLDDDPPPLEVSGRRTGLGVAETIGSAHEEEIPSLSLRGPISKDYRLCSGRGRQCKVSDRGFFRRHVGSKEGIDHPDSAARQSEGIPRRK